MSRWWRGLPVVVIYGLALVMWAWPLSALCWMLTEGQVRWWRGLPVSTRDALEMAAVVVAAALILLVASAI